jgi:D-alanyl-lipoteichoic acid acyltransferase DltB (MBOAT superfamily)
MLPQFKQLKPADYDMIKTGLKMMLWGYFMKLVVADRLGIYIDVIYDNIPQHNGTSLLLASLLVPFQIYADLGGYSLIAIGTASILGFKVMQNFKRPFFATSMADLWRRWHISLITWLTDYVYTPLTFSFRKYKLKGIILALMITFLISGIWHGAALTFIVWGFMQGVYLSIEALTSRKRMMVEKKYNLTKKGWYIFIEIMTVFILFTASQIVGRAGTLHAAGEVFRKIFTAWGPLFIGEAPSILIYSILGLLMLLFKDFMDEFVPSKFLLFENKNKAIRVMAYSSIIILILLIGVLDGSQFLYFKF